MRTKQDARRDPRPGDVIDNCGHPVSVIRLIDEGFEGDVSRTVVIQREVGAPYTVSLFEWRCIAEGVKVLHVAQEGGEE